MNLLGWVKMLHQVKLRVSHLEIKKSNWPKLGENLNCWVKTRPNFPMRRTWNLYALRHFEADFEGLPGVQIECRISRWKAIPVYFATQVEFMNLVAIFPSKNEFSQHCFLCVQKGAERSFLGCFWPLRQPKNCKNIDVIWCNFMGLDVISANFYSSK